MAQTPDYTFEIAQLNALKNTKLAYLLRTDLQGNYIYANDKYVSDFGWIHGSETEFNFVGTIVCPLLVPTTKLWLPMWLPNVLLRPIRFLLQPLTNLCKTDK